MNPESWSWDEVEDRFRAIRDRYQSMAAMAARMLELVAVVRHDPRIEHRARWVSHVSLIVAEPDRRVGISYSDPGGIAWSGEEGFNVYLVDFKDMTTRQHLVVQEDGVMAAVLERLASG